MTVKSSLLEMLEKNKGEVLSGESIAGELGCTRAAVWKAVKSLREEGYHIEAGPNKGYMFLIRTVCRRKESACFWMIRRLR